MSIGYGAIAAIGAFGLATLLLCLTGLRLRRVVAERDHAASQAREREFALRQCVDERTAELTAAGVELETVALNVAQDLRMPLNAIDGFAEMLLRRADNGLASDAIGYLNRIRVNAAQMSGLIEDMRKFSRLARRTPNLRPVDTRAQVQGCLEAARNGYRSRSVRVVIHELPDCEADPALLRQVWMELLDNAFKFTAHRSSPRIEIGGRSDDSGMSYFVRDNGAGFDMGDADQLFRLFHRLEGASEYAGNGTGLAVVRRIVQHHGGIVRAEAEPGIGATFHFTLPRRCH